MTHKVKQNICGYVVDYFVRQSINISNRLVNYLKL